VRKTEILAEQQPPQRVFVCDHAGLVIDKFPLETGGYVDCQAQREEECFTIIKPSERDQIAVCRSLI
jgi:hypothetical protein